MCCLIIMALLLIMNICSIVFDPGDNYINIIGIIVGIVFFVVYFLGYRGIVRLSVKRQKEISSQSPVTYTVSATESSLLHRSSAGSDIEVDFTKINKIFQTKNYIILLSDARLMYSFDKNHFTVGNPQDLLQFLRSKGFKTMKHKSGVASSSAPFYSFQK